MTKENKEKKENSLSESNLIVLLKSFTKEEIKQFDKFVHSQFHNNRSEVTKFFDHIKKYHPSFEGAEMGKEKIYLALYGNSVYRDDVMRRLSSNLFILAEEYGAITEARANKLEFHKNLSHFYLNRFIDDLYLKQERKAEKYLEEQLLRDAKYFLYVNFFEETKRIFLINSDPIGKKTNVQKQIDSVWKFSAITLFRLYKIAIEHSKQFNKKYDLTLLEPLMKIIEQSGFRDSKAVEIWYLLIKFHTDSKNEETFTSLNKLLKKHFNVFDQIESFIISVSLLGYCYEMNIIPDKNFHKQEYEIISQMLSSGLLIQGQTIYSEWFMYAFLSALRAGELAAAENMVSEYGEMIPKKERRNVLNHAYAELEIEKKDYNAALKYLSLPNYNNVAEKLRANQMYTKIYYELNSTEQFFYTVDSFKHLINNEASLSKDVKKIRENFIYYTTLLYKYKIRETKYSLQQIKKEVYKTKILGNKWLLRKIEELEKKEKK